MYIAICDDNVADRKHIERLLSRESDKRSGTTNILYVDSFGNRERFLNNPLKYDMIFMDMTSTPTIAEEIINHLTAIGCNAPLILYSSKIDYTTLSNLPENVIHEKKPYIPDPLPELLKLGDMHALNYKETISVPCSDGVRYIPKNDILYCTFYRSNYLIGLQDGSFMTLSGNINEFRFLVAPYDEFYCLDKKHIINMKYVSSINPIAITMQDYRKFYYLPFRYSALKELKEKIDGFAI